MLISQLTPKDYVWLTIFQREKNILSDIFIRVSILFSRFALKVWCSNRYVSSRYQLNKLAKTAGNTGYYNYCFSHSKKISAAILSFDNEKVSIDIEPTERRLTKALEIKVRELFPILALSELEILMILECLVKVQPAGFSFSLVAVLFRDGPAEIISLGQETFEVRFQDTRVYSRIYNFNNLFICITREKNKFPLNL